MHHYEGINMVVLDVNQSPHRTDGAPQRVDGRPPESPHVAMLHSTLKEAAGCRDQRRRRDLMRAALGYAAADARVCAEEAYFRDGDLPAALATAARHLADLAQRERAAANHHLADLAQRHGEVRR